MTSAANKWDDMIIPMIWDIMFISARKNCSEIDPNCIVSQFCLCQWLNFSLGYCSRCVCEPAVPLGDHMWLGSVCRLPVCDMEVILGAMAKSLLARPKGPAGRAAAGPDRGGGPGAGIQRRLREGSQCADSAPRVVHEDQPHVPGHPPGGPD